jgi:orotate phosphoribosyltransferase
MGTLEPTVHIPADSRAHAVLQGQKCLMTLRTATGLRGAAASIEEAAQASGCFDVAAASGAAQSAIAAAILLSDGAVRCVDEADVAAGRVDKVLVVEAVAISGLKVRRTVEALRGAGAAWVGVVVLHDMATGVGGDQFGSPDDVVGWSAATPLSVLS